MSSKVTPKTLGTISLAIVAGIIAVVLFSTRMQSLDTQLREAIAEQNIAPIDLNIPENEAKVELGQALFFDKILSGNRDISCATCHHPTLGTGDALALSIGTGGHGLGEERVLGEDRGLVPRNAPELFNRGSTLWTTMFWDGRVASEPYELDTPADDLLPDGLDSPLAAQAMFPPTSRDEMLGERGDYDANGDPNEVGLVDETDQRQVWQALTERIIAVPEYQTMLAAAYPDVALDDVGFEHAANAIAAFEISAFSQDDSPWFDYVAGDDTALTDDQKEGALLFYGKAGCAQCHSGSLMTDQDFHNIGVPQLGPGKNSVAGMDLGRSLETDDPADQFAFRTPPLNNVALTGPYMHNGAYTTLEAAVRHHFDPINALNNYDASQLSDLVRPTYWSNPSITVLISQSLDPLLGNIEDLSDKEFDQLIAFLNSLTCASAEDLVHIVPDSVPSGLPVAD